MKKLVLVMLLVTLKSLVNAQTKIDDYQLTYFKKSFDINASQYKNDTSKFTYYIDAGSADERHEKVCLDIESKNLPDFVSFLNNAKVIYAKWKETAIANNVTELSKDIEIKPFKCAVAFIYGDWNFDFNVLLSTRVKIIDGKMVLIMESGELQSSSNEFMKHKGLLIVFTNIDEVDSFLNKLDPIKVKAVFSKINNTNALFKN